MKNIFTLINLLIIVASVNARTPDFENCYTTEIYRERIKNHPEILQAREALEQHTLQVESRSTPSSAAGTPVYVIPIVFHIIHNYGPENISDAQIIDQVRILNEDFRKRSYDTGLIVPAFQSIAADCMIEFRLATIDPNGNCTSGIEHIPSMLTYHAEDNAKLNPWPSDKYMNVWVVASMAWSGVAAYAYYPGTAPPDADGVIIASRYVGSIGNSAGLGTSRILTHEIGHCLNLSHVWGDTNDPGVSCGDDHVGDTPQTSGWTYCNRNGATCGNVIDNVQNYMEYSYCCSMFTEGQKNRMRACLTSPIAGRDNLWTTTNLQLTGTTGTPGLVCNPITDFNTNYKTICEGNTIQFKDLTWSGHPTSWNWSFPGGTPSASSDSMPLIAYNTPGVYNVTLRSSNSTGIDSMTKNLYIRVNGTTTQLAPYAEGFEISGSFPGDGYVINPDNGNAWQRVTNAGSSGTASIMMNNFSSNPVGELDEYITPPVDLSGLSAPTLTFKLAYAQRNSFDTTALKIYVSSDCGQSWTQRYNKVGAVLSTSGILSSPFVPNSSQWRSETVNIYPFHNLTDVRFKFQSTNRGGNYLYVDDINIHAITTGIDDPEMIDALFSVYPNPTSGNFDLTFSTEKKQQITLQITDAVGREIYTVVNAELSAGEHKFSINKNLETGIYFVRLNNEAGIITRKLLVTK